ncbi:nicotinamide mononucleotide transporter family protein [Deinococcus sp.]|uniref:nicotinamide mononucleotide transporter family protein n=1 Tax=Deinococcus sp. TaxID=47478 RepID=UPI0025CC7E6B|nr:nicotinamide mononucleotide transporter family protein [Deinococcus sp.]
MTDLAALIARIPPLALDLSGALAVLASLHFLFAKARAYWHWSNLSLLPYFLLFVAGGQWQLAGLQICYLIFGVHGLYLWHLEAQRDRGGVQFNEGAWYGVTWVASLTIFGYTVYVTDFSQPWNWVQFAVVGVSLVANFGTTRRQAWSWPVWILANAVGAVFYFHTQYWALFTLQFVLAAMSAYGWTVWSKDERRVLAVA